MTDFSYISNSSPLIAFMKKKELNLLKKLFKEIIIPEAVYEELIAKAKKQEDQVKLLEEAIKDGLIIVKKLKNFKIADLNLGKGEKEVINLCFEIENPLLLIDEKKGSSIARVFKIQTLGTLGILLLSKKRGIKTRGALLDNLDILIKKNFYLSSEVITMFLKEIEL
jgi:predicted nucleic acid-binding protein